ncbi:MAG: ABC transporter permease [Cyclobacteriaceae bacterium]
MIKHLAQQFFQWFCHPDYFDEIQGDLEEIYQRNQVEGKRRAQWKYLLQVLVLFRPSLIRSFPQSYLTQSAMFRHYFNISTRVLLRHKFYSAINILGLAVGMGIALLIYQYIHFELSYDQFHANAEGIYRIWFSGTENGEDIGIDNDTTNGLGPRSKETIPEVKDFARVHPHYIGPIVTNPEKNEPYQEDNLWYVDSNFLQMFSFPLKYGNKESVLEEKYNVVITEQLATKYFGNTDPTGKILKFELGNLGGEFTVTGVVQDLPINSHMQFDVLLPMNNLLDDYGAYKNGDGWTWDNFLTYVTLHENTDLTRTGEKFDQIVEAYVGERLAQDNVVLATEFRPLPEIYLNANSSKSGQNMRTFTIIATFILLMAWVNYINLSTARALQRAKEVGVRKSIGALKQQLVSQFMIESLLINLVAALLSIGLTYLMLPTLNGILGKEIPFNLIQSVDFWLIFLLIVLLGTLLSGLYPSFVLSSFRPVRVLKSIRVSPQRGFSVRKGLIVFQFMISLLLVAGTYLVYKQVNFMQNQEMGIDMEEILVVHGPRIIDYDSLRRNYETFKNEAARHHSILAISGTGTVPGTGNMFRGKVWRRNKSRDTGQVINLEQVDVDFTQTFDLPLIAGKPFTKEMQRFGDNGPVIINEKAVKDFGFDSAEEAIGEKLITILGDTIEIEVVGVVKDFYWNSLREAHMPYLFALNHEYGAYFSFRINLSDIPTTIDHIKSTYSALFPGNPFNYFFLNDNFNQQYQADLQFGNLFSAFSGLAIFIACLGLFALVSYSATLRIKEIGIRKVLGASINNLMLLLSREYLVLLLIAIVLAVPATILGGRTWLENYAYKTEIGLDLLLFPGLILMLISVLTVSYRTYATAKTNPVESLRTE